MAGSSKADLPILIKGQEFLSFVPPVISVSLGPDQLKKLRLNGRNLLLFPNIIVVEKILTSGKIGIGWRVSG